MATKLSSTMKKMKAEQVKQVETARKNVSVSKGTSKNSKVLKEGVPLDHSIKQSPQDSVKFGMSKGITKNMGDYESLRVDVWLTDEVREGESIEEAYARVGEILDKVLEETVLSTVG